MNDQVVAGLAASIPAILIAIGGLMKIRNDARESEARLKLETQQAETRLKAENELIAKEVEQRLHDQEQDVAKKLQKSQNESAAQLDEIHKTFNSRMEQAMKDLQEKWYAIGLKEGEERATQAAIEKVHQSQPK